MAPEPGRWQLTRPDTVLSVAAREGADPPVVLVPGVMSDAAGWWPVVDALATDAAVHVLERRGRAPNGPLGPDHGIEREVDDVRALLDALPGPKHLVAWSYGALLALEAAVGRTDLVSVTGYEPVSRPFAPHALAPIRAALAADDLDRAVELVNIEVSGFPAERVAALRSTPAWGELRRLAAPLGGELAAVNRFDPHYADYATITAPVTLLIGRLNTGGLEPYGAAFERFRAALPEAVADVLPGVGHLAHVDAPTLLAARISAALAG